MQRKSFAGGVIPAILLPRDESGRPVWESFDANLKFVLERGVAGVCVNGATGEYAASTEAERREAVRRAKVCAGNKALVVGATGAAHWQEALRNARAAEEEGADLLLVPVPHFFPYQQDEVAEFYRRMGACTQLPILIYNLPQFAGGVEPAVALRLICEERSVAGIKDSSGSLEILEALTARAGTPSIRLLGNDAVLAEALSRGLCAGVISGVACVLPELITGLFAAKAEGAAESFASLAGRLAEFIAHLNVLPVPWGLKVVAERRGLGKATYAMPLTPRREEQIAEFGAWLAGWWPPVLEQCLGAMPAGARGRE